MRYFSKIQLYQHHGDEGEADDTLCSYSFALQPEEHQPSGTCNFSGRAMELDFPAPAEPSGNNPECVDVYAMSYNVLRVMSEGILPTLTKLDA